MYQLLTIGISIHALLAESDVDDRTRAFEIDLISIHALLAESDQRGPRPHKRR